MKEFMVILALLFVVPASVSAQNTDHQPRGLGYIFYGAATHQMGQTAGFGGEAYVYKGLGASLEIGTAGYTTSAYGNPNWIGVGSLDLSYHYFRKKLQGRPTPFVTGGYTDFFGQDTDVSENQARGFNIGGGLDFFATRRLGVRFDVRYYGHGDHILWPSFPGLAQLSFAAFRIGLTFR
jgi:opacity protein-like surface antigen